MTGLASHGAFHVPAFVSITDVTPEGSDTTDYVITNEATGRHFKANLATVQFLHAMMTSGSVAFSAQACGLAAQQGNGLVQQMSDYGVLVQSGETRSKPNQIKAPLESKIVSMRWDIFDSSAITDGFGWLGRLLYSRAGYIGWFFAIGWMGFELLVNRDKVALTLGQVLDASFSQWLLFAVLFIGMKAFHELGHAVAYREMCRQEGLDPGPIRMGICIFAFTPFPFTDVTGAWRLRARWRRIMIGAGGIYFETWVMVALTVFWAHTTSGMFQTVSLQVAVIAGALALLFNLNPAVKLDGYFMLTDFLRRPNLAARSSFAARGFAARCLGAELAQQNRADLTYWVLSYLYRWSIFIGIFWLVYQFDKRLAPFFAVIILLMLVGRPLLNTIRFALQKGVKTMHATVLVTGFAGLAMLSMVPFAYWQTVPGQIIRYETRYLEPTEAGRVLRRTDGGYSLNNPELDQQIFDLELRLQTLGNMQRANFASSQEQARLAAEVKLIVDARNALTERRQALDVSSSPDAIWTDLDSRKLDGSWVAAGPQNRLAAVSEPTKAHLRLRLDQRYLERSLDLGDGTMITARVTHDPQCKLTAAIERRDANLLSVNGEILLKANLAETLPECEAQTQNVLAHGVAVVARVQGAPQSVFERFRRFAARLLQDRLDINAPDTTTNTR